jgi:O-antigen/teichoic acid export membrane protein
MCAAALAFNVALNIKLIPTLGIVGAAWSTVATELVITSGCVIAIARISSRSNLSNLSNPSNLSAVPS